MQITRLMQVGGPVLVPVWARALVLVLERSLAGLQVLARVLVQASVQALAQLRVPF